MMSSTQKTLLYANIPTLIYGYTIDKRLKDRFPMSPITYPAIEVKFMSEGIKKHWSTWAPTRVILNEETGVYDSYYGEQDVANISLTVWSETEDELRIICEGLELYLKIAGLDLYWPDDHIKVTGIKGVQLLEPYADEFVQEHTWRAVIDFSVEYLWDKIDLDPEIKSFEYLFTNGNELRSNNIKAGAGFESLDTLVSYMPGAYGMTINILGWKVSYLMDLIALRDCPESVSMDIKIVA